MTVGGFDEQRWPAWKPTEEQRGRDVLPGDSSQGTKWEWGHCIQEAGKSPAFLNEAKMHAYPGWSQISEQLKYQRKASEMGVISSSEYNSFNRAGTRWKHYFNTYKYKNKVWIWKAPSLRVILYNYLWPPESLHNITTHIHWTVAKCQALC